jgi:tight adherence protein B
MSKVDLILSVASFVAVLGLWIVALTLWSLHRRKRRDRVGQRLGLVADSDADARVLRLWHDGRESVTHVPGTGRRRGWLARLDELRIQAGWNMPAGSLVMMLAGGCVLMIVLSLLISGRVLGGLAGAAGLLLIFWAVLKHRVNRRTAVFEQQFVDALDLAGRSLRAGHPLTGAMRLVSEEIGEPVGHIFGQICQEQEMGASLEAALREQARRSPSGDMKLFATSVSIQLRSGGNLAEMMDRLALVIRERIRLSRRVRVLTAQTQFSKRILAALPLVLFAVLNLLSPSYIEPLYTTATGQILLLLAGVIVVLGVLVMNRMSKLRY